MIRAELASATGDAVRSGEHIHDATELLLVEAGGVRLSVDGHHSLLRPGSLAVISPFAVHSLDPIDASPTTQIRTYHIPASQPLRLPAYAPIRGRRFQILEDATLAAQAKALHAALEQRQLAPAVADGQLHQLSERVGRLVHRAEGSPVMRHRAVERACDFIEANLSRSVHVAEMARHAGLSSYYLIRVFRRVVGLPPHAFMEQLRIARGKAMLREGVAISAVAYRTGFADQSHFTRHFKRAVGVTPGRYALAWRHPFLLEGLAARAN